nr:phage tail tape measure protein [uncultured Dethiosulfovibrio sp.]
MSKRDVQINVGAKVDQAVSSFNRLQKTLYLNGRRLEGYGETIGKVFDPAMKGLLAVGATAKVAATGVGIAAFSVAQELEEAMAIVAKKTGESGEALKGYEEIVRKLFRENPVEGYGQVAEALAAVRVASGATGADLEKLTQHYLSLAEVTGSDLSSSILLGSRLFGDWSISTEHQTEALDALFVASRSTGTSIEGLAEKAVTYGTKFRLLGFSLEETLGLLGKWEKEGVSTEKALSGLGQAITNMTKGGVQDLGRGWRDLTDSIKNASTEGEAINKAVKYFGADAGPDMAAAIRENRFELGGLVEVLSKASGAILKADEDTSTLGDALHSLKNTAKDKLLEPLGDEVSRYVAHVAKLLEVLVEWADKNQILKVSVDAFFEGFGLGKVQVEEFKDALERIDVASITDQCETFGRMLKAIYQSLNAIAEAIPWEFLIDHADSLTKIIIYGWAAGKVMAIAGGILTLSKSFKGLADSMNLFATAQVLLEGSTLFSWLIGRSGKKGVEKGLVLAGEASKGLAIAGTAASTTMKMLSKVVGSAVFDVLVFPEAIGEVNYSIEDMTAAMEGNEEALERLPDKVKEWLIQTGQIKKSVEDIKDMKEELKGLNEEGFSNPDDLLREWGKKQAELAQRQLSKVALSVSDLQERIKDFREQGKDAMELFGLSALEADEIIRDSVMQVAEDLRKSLADESPYMATAFVNAMEKMGLDGGDALMTSIARAMGKKKDLPIKTLTGAIQEGFIKGTALPEAMKLIQGQSEEVAKKAGEAIEKELAGLGLSSRLMDSLKAYSAKLELANFGIQSTAPKLQGSGRSVTNVNTPVSVQIGTVNVGKPEDAKKTGQSIGEGISRSFYPSY